MHKANRLLNQKPATDAGMAVRARPSPRPADKLPADELPDRLHDESPADKLLADTAAPEVGELTDMLAGREKSSGYLEVASAPGSQFFYSLWKKPGTRDSNTPIVIGNPGGPGLAAEVLLTMGGGPLQEIYEGEGAGNFAKAASTYFDHADVLLPDIPGTMGFSIPAHPLPEVEESLKQALDFVVAIGEKEAFGNRKIYFYGTSYGAGVTSYLAKNLRDMGWNIAGLLLDSPFINPMSWMNAFPAVCKNFGIWEGAKGQALQKEWEPAVEKCTAALNVHTGTADLDPETALLCDSIYNTAAPYCGDDTTCVMTSYDMNPDPASNVYYLLMQALLYGQSPMSGEKFQTMMGGKKTMEMMDHEIYEKDQILGFWENYQPYWEDLHKHGVPMHILIGTWDAITGWEVTQDWLKPLFPAWDQIKWAETDVGTKGQVDATLIYETLYGAPHFTGITHPQSIVSALCDMMGCSTTPSK